MFKNGGNFCAKYNKKSEINYKEVGSLNERQTTRF